MEQFSQVSGLRINKEKTKCLLIGKSIDISSLMDAGLNIVNELRVLGIVYNESNKNIVTRNIQEILPKDQTRNRSEETEEPYLNR